jgi:hypothetical protein
MDIGVGAYSRGRQTLYSTMGVVHSMYNWHSWCRGLGVSHKNFEIFSSGGNFRWERLPPQASYGDRGKYRLKSTSNYIFYHEAEFF